MHPDYTNVSYYPNYEEYTARNNKRLDDGSIDQTLPPGFPRLLHSKMVWEGERFSLHEHTSSDGTEYILELNGSQLAEIDTALKHFQALKRPLSELSPSTFPLPLLHQNLRSVSENLHKGSGFTFIRGVPVDKYNAEENMIIYVGVSSHIGCVRGRQDKSFEGNPADVMVAHIADFRHPGGDDKVVIPAYTDGEVPFHTDLGNIVSLFTLSEPVSGGETVLASSWRVYNELARTRPDLIRVLADEWDIPSASKDAVVRRLPLLFYQPPHNTAPERIIIQFSRRSFSKLSANPLSKPLTEAQRDSLDALHFLAKKFQVSIPLKKGDMQFINNLSIVHARSSYVDDSTHRRHLLRLWLWDPENSWEIPDPLRHRWDSLYDPASSHGPQVFPLHPTARSMAAVQNRT
ncbi:hypothetical protein O988_00265 [Pseudogymnoascus sp. VKM F-3808]|nr:hypothetical protein O988_00265 [Pseudogymnoascus sp. VKM F-3808]